MASAPTPTPDPARQPQTPLPATQPKPLPRPKAAPDHVLDSGTMKVGFSRAMGGAIVHVSTPHVLTGTNLVNTFDPGRLVQQSYYAGQKVSRPQHHPRWNPWPWNPIQGGDAFNFTPGCSVFEPRDGAFVTESTGLNWPARDERLRNLIRQRAQFIAPDVLKVECEFILDRTPGDAWGAARPSHQEIPAGYFVADLPRLITYRDGKPVEFPHKMWNYAEKLPERWAAAIGTDNRGIALYSREATIANLGKSGTGGGGPDSPVTMHIAPLITRALKPQDRLTYTYYLLTGDLETMRATALRLYAEGK